MNFTSAQIAAECGVSGLLLAPLPASITGPQLLWAISGNESRFGKNCSPRHEPAFDVGGVYSDGPVMKPLLAKYGSAAACSYGPWQIMFCNAPNTYTPQSFDNLTQCAQATVQLLNKFLRRWQPLSLATIGECWNAGRPVAIPTAGVGRYIVELAANYAQPMVGAT